MIFLVIIPCNFSSMVSSALPNLIPNYLLSMFPSDLTSAVPSNLPSTFPSNLSSAVSAVEQKSIYGPQPSNTLYEKRV